MRNIELLAPARNKECGMTAIDHGADAVYIGAACFGARRAAGNSLEDIRDLCQYAHIYNAKVYATVNTVVYDNETDDAVRLVGELKEAGIDAILIQDMGLLSMIKDMGVELHASTQTDNRDRTKVGWLRRNGFRRVVLARELSVGEISSIHESTPDIELEAFVHGALCVSYSGQCYASEYVKGRSANRGECAQMCRMKYSLRDAEGKSIGPDAYYLSLKDQCQIDNMESLLKAGVVSLKIEGRLKDITYVKNVVAAYSRRLDDIIKRHNAAETHGDEWRRASWGHVDLDFEPDLDRSYNRGYTTYFANGRQRNMASFFTPKALGQYVGRVKELRGGRCPSFNVAGTAPFVNGDGLCFINGEGELQGFRVNRAEGNRLYPYVMPLGLRPGTALYRSQDKAFDTMLERKTARRTIPVRISLKETAVGVKMEIGATDGIPLHGESTLEMTGWQTADKPQRENIIRQITKLGNTPYVCKELDIDEQLDKIFIPSSLLAETRRRAVSSMICRMSPDNRDEGCHVETHQKNRGEDGKTGCVNPYGTSFTYLYNADNRAAKRFFAECGIKDASGFTDIPTRTNAMADVGNKPYETGPLLMQCRYCLRYEMGYCIKNGGKKPYWKEPLRLSLADGTTFILGFDCKRCQMLVYGKK
ncbi:MAG: U32 family peptidase [Prevotella sp.]